MDWLRAPHKNRSHTPTPLFLFFSLCCERCLDVVVGVVAAVMEVDFFAYLFVWPENREPLLTYLWVLFVNVIQSL